jgi:hypothetical protein
MSTKAANIFVKQLRTAFDEGRTYFVFNKLDELEAGPIGKDGALIRTFHDKSLFYVCARNMSDMIAISACNIPADLYRVYS